MEWIQKSNSKIIREGNKLSENKQEEIYIVIYFDWIYEKIKGAFFDEEAAKKCCEDSLKEELKKNHPGYEDDIAWRDLFEFKDHDIKCYGKRCALDTHIDNEPHYTEYYKIPLGKTLDLKIQAY
jgi:hypothetical protein